MLSTLMRQERALPVLTDELDDEPPLVPGDCCVTLITTVTPFGPDWTDATAAVVFGRGVPDWPGLGAWACTDRGNNAARPASATQSSRPIAPSSA